MPVLTLPNDANLPGLPTTSKEEYDKIIEMLWMITERLNRIEILVKQKQPIYVISSGNTKKTNQ